MYEAERGPFTSVALEYTPVMRVGETRTAAHSQVQAARPLYGSAKRPDKEDNGYCEMIGD